jgi:hypothetical protein
MKCKNRNAEGLNRENSTCGEYQNRELWAPSGWMKFAPETIAPDTGELRKILNEDLSEYGYKIIQGNLTPRYSAGEGLTPLGTMPEPVQDSREFLPEIILDYVQHDTDGYPEYLIRLITHEGVK